MWNYILHSFKCNVWISFSLARIKEKKGKKIYFWKTIKIRFVEVWEGHRDVFLSSSRIEVLITFSSCLAVQEDANKDFIKSNMPNKGILRNHREEGEDPKSSTTSAGEVVAIRLLTPGCRGAAQTQCMNQVLPQLPQAPGLFLSVCWCLGCARNPAGTVPLGHIICRPQLQRDSPPHHAGALS